MQIVNASIITIGDELLIGQTVDTNSAFIAQELNKIGIWVRRRVAVGDVKEDIKAALDEERKLSEIIIMTGGLGPTADDITKPLLCEYFGARLLVNEQVLAHVKYLFEKIFRRPGPILESNLKQAEVPDNCIVLHNKRGTAPGMLWMASPNPSTGGVSDPDTLQETASPNPSTGGALDPDTSEKHYWIETADPAVYGLLKNFVKEHKENPTLAESILWKMLRGKQLAGYKFRRQHIIRTFIADFICISKKLIIEVDGLIHQVPENKLSDEARTIELNMAGFQVLRFSNEEVINDTENVLKKIIAALEKRNLELSESKNPPFGGRETSIDQPESENPPMGGRGANINQGRGNIFISLPGVPHEMKGLMVDEVVPRLQAALTLPAIVHKTAFTAGQGESFIAEQLKDFESALPVHIKLAYLPNYGLVKLRLTATGNDPQETEKDVLPWFEKMQVIIKEWLVSNEDEGLENVIGKILRSAGKTLSTAESCTGGYIAHLITSVPGSSDYFKGSVVSYSNEMKENILGISPATIMTMGAVSEETVRQMALGAIHKMNSDFSLATSGIMGPGGGTADKPVGTVWIAVSNGKKTDAKQFNFRFDRQRNIIMTALTALNFLRKFILEET
ncbi:MAG TPA: nicotinamide-nucleotide amidohydrolase family protein [Chitinophagaceae bacterium]|nr:nicotinamide-nucleotide amidohydrolase family protein [Chitinophagaceae bacterium]